MIKMNILNVEVLQVSRTYLLFENRLPDVTAENSDLHDKLSSTTISSRSACSVTNSFACATCNAKWTFAACAWFPAISSAPSLQRSSASATNPFVYAVFQSYTDTDTNSTQCPGYASCHPRWPKGSPITTSMPHFLSNLHYLNHISRTWSCKFCHTLQSKSVS